VLLAARVGVWLVGMGERAGRLARVHQLINAEPAVADAPAGMPGRLLRLCSALVRALPVTGAGVSLLTEDHAGGGTAAASNQACHRIQELQFGLAEGPGMDAFLSRRPVLAPDLAEPGWRRWPAYGPAAHDQGVRAEFAFPLQVGAARLGALDLYRDEPRSLSTDSLREAFTFAEVAVGVLLDGQHSAPGSKPTENR
jgi:GAF domain